MALNLYELTKDMQDLQEAIEKGELTTHEAKPIKDVIKDELSRKGEGIIFVLRNMEADINTLDGEIKRLQELKKRKTKSYDDLKAKTKKVMEETEMKSIKTTFGNITVRKPQPSVIIKDLADIPEEFKVAKTEIKADGKALLRHFKETGEIVAGTEIEFKSSLLVPKAKEEK